MRRCAPSAAASLVGLSALAASVPAAERPDIRVFLQAASRDEKEAKAAREELARSWSTDHADAIMLVELARFMRPLRRPLPGGRDDVALAEADNPSGPPAPGFEIPHGAPQDPSGFTRARLIRLLEKQTGQRFGDDLQRWRQWIWSRPAALHPDYVPFKAALYGKVDPRFADFFAPGAKARIRLDEVDWGGVTVNGIPPLDHPRHVPAAEARWLKDDHVVFGVELNGESRAYPKRVLAWHELARDRVGNVELTLVYCTLCGTVIPYGSEAGGRRFTLGTSGLLYRSNKLMFDEETRSLWSALEGRPVVGPLADSGLSLTAHPVVTTTWREWRAAHPQTTVLSRDTGHERDYAEGAAYREYFASDDLMFTVPRTDARLKNKEEVLALRLVPPDAPAGTAPRALALSASFLKKRPFHPVRFAGHDLLVLTTPDGANRVYDTGGTAFVRQRGDGALEDAEGRLWRVGEDALVRVDPRDREAVSPDERRRIHSGAAEAQRRRVAAHRAFWFGWYAQFPDTELVR